MNRSEKSRMAWRWQRGLIDEGWVVVFTKAEDKLARYVSYVVDWDKRLLWGSARGIQEKVGISYRVVSWVEAKFLGYGLFDGWEMRKVRGQPQHILRVAFPVPKLDMKRVIDVRVSLSHHKGNSWEKLTVALKEKGLLHHGSSELSHHEGNISIKNNEIEQFFIPDFAKPYVPEKVEEWVRAKLLTIPLTPERVEKACMKMKIHKDNYLKRYFKERNFQ